jgi:hypothetical protein
MTLAFEFTHVAAQKGSSWNEIRLKKKGEIFVQQSLIGAAMRFGFP